MKFGEIDRVFDAFQMCDVNSVSLTGTGNAKPPTIRNDGRWKVAWVRVDTQTILSIHHNVITQNPRISLSYNDHRSWYLHIKNVVEADRGWYMCQVNTDPMRSRQGYLQVVGLEEFIMLDNHTV
ncbi:hypothetical protein RUM44_010469 [Polyplax serrata]|uniref:Ig-like domain-containing protein n=1 Tax=Polyplax serrata TaxID=468196 RepID=A0ABR1AVM4_POLSC